MKKTLPIFALTLLLSTPCALADNTPLSFKYAQHAETYLKQGKTKEALQYVNASIKTAGPNKDQVENAYEVRAMIYATMGEDKKAIEDVEYISNLIGKDSPRIYMINEFFKAGKVKLAIALQKNQIENSSNKGEQSQDAGERCYRYRDKDKSLKDIGIEFFKKSRELGNSNSRSFIFESYFYTRDHESGKAMDILSKGLEKHPQDSILLATRAELLFDMQCYEKALEDMRKAIENAAPGYKYECFLLRQDNFVKCGLFEDAFADLNEAIKLQPNNYQPYTLEIDLYTKIGEFKKAEEKLVAFETKFKGAFEQLEAVKSRVGIETRKRNYKKCQTLFEEAVKKFPRDKHLLNIHALNYLYLGEIDKGIEACDLWYQKVTSDNMALVVKAIAFDLKGDHESSKKSFEEAIKKDSHLEEAYTRFIYSLLQQNKREKAVEVLNALTSANPKSSRMQTGKAIFFLTLKDKKAAMAAFEKALSMDKTIDASLYYVDYLCKTGDLEKSQKLLAEITPRAEKLQDKSEIALLYNSSGNRKQSMEYIESVLKEAKHADLYRVKGKNLFNEGNTTEGVDLLEKATRTLPITDLNWYHLGCAYRLIGEYDKALEAFKQSIKINGDKADWTIELGLTLKGLGQTEEAKKIFQDTITIANQNGIHGGFTDLTLRNLGRAYLGLDQFEKAKEMAERAISCDYYNDDAHFTLGMALEGLGKNEEAISEYKKAISLIGHTKDFDYDVRLALLYEKMGKKDERSQLQKELERVGINLDTQKKIWN